MNDDLSQRSCELVEATRALLSALEAWQDEDEIGDLELAQREAFNAFALQCDPDAERPACVERDIDELLELDRRIVEVARERSVRLLAQRRSVSTRQNAARAFRSQEEAPPRFFNQRI